MSEDSEFSPFLGQIVRIDSERHKLPIYGRLTTVSDQFLTVERKDGRLTLIKRKTILAIEPTRIQPTEAV